MVQTAEDFIDKSVHIYLKEGDETDISGTIVNILEKGIILSDIEEGEEGENVKVTYYIPFSNISYIRHKSEKYEK